MLLLLCCIYFAYKAIDFPIHDFANYYFGGKFLADGTFSDKTYFPYEFNKAIADLGYKGIFVSYAPNTPFLAFFFLPFSLLGAATAKLVFNVISIGLFVFSLVRLFSFYKIDYRFALLIPIVFLVPIKNSLLFGQVYFLLFFLLAEGWLAYEKEQFKLTGLLWALAILLKVFPVLLLVFLVFKRKWSAIFSIIVFGFLLLGISLFATGIGIWDFYLKEVLPKASNGEIATAFVDNYQSVFMFLKRIFVYEPVENPHPFSSASSYFPILMLAFKIGILTIGFFITKRKSNLFFAFAFWITAMLLLSPYGSTYSLILLVFPFLALLKSEISNVKKGFFSIVLILICNLPFNVFFDLPFPLSYLRMLLFLGFVLFFTGFELSKLKWLKAFSFSGIVFIIGTFVSQSPPHKEEVYVGMPILVYDYRIEDDLLIYSYWNINGENQGLLSFKNETVEELGIRENQIVYKNRLVTNDNSNKLKPMLVDGKMILYLSDYGRGIGFYTLRKIELE